MGLSFSGQFNQTAQKIPKTKHASTRIGRREALGRQPPAISARRRKTAATQPNTTDYYSPAKEKEWISVPHPEQRGEPRSGGPRERERPRYARRRCARLRGAGSGLGFGFFFRAVVMKRRGVLLVGGKWGGEEGRRKAPEMRMFLRSTAIPRFKKPADTKKIAHKKKPIEIYLIQNVNSEILN
jgi:hypothetical protein